MHKLHESVVGFSCLWSIKPIFYQSCLFVLPGFPLCLWWNFIWGFYNSTYIMFDNSLTGTAAYVTNTMHPFSVCECARVEDWRSNFVWFLIFSHYYINLILESILFPLFPCAGGEGGAVWRRVAPGGGALHHSGGQQNPDSLHSHSYHRWAQPNVGSLSCNWCLQMFRHF